MGLSRIFISETLVDIEVKFKLYIHCFVNVLLRKKIRIKMSSFTSQKTRFDTIKGIKINRVFPVDLE